MRSGEKGRSINVIYYHYYIIIIIIIIIISVHEKGKQSIYVRCTDIGCHLVVRNETRNGFHLLDNACCTQDTSNLHVHVVHISQLCARI